MKSHTPSRRLLAGLAALALAATAFAWTHQDQAMIDEHNAIVGLVPTANATHTAVASGNWNTAATWSTGTVPGAGARVYIPSGLTVIYNRNSTARLQWVRNDGTLRFATGVNTTLVVDTLFSNSGSVFECGTEAAPIGNTVKARLLTAANGPIDRTNDPRAFGRGFLFHGSTTIFGQPKTAFAKVNSTTGLAKDATTISLVSAPTNWQVGDQLLVTGTQWRDLQNNPPTNKLAWRYASNDSVVTITDISGSTVTVTPLPYAHPIQTAYQGIAGVGLYVGNLTRNVEFASENPAAPTTEWGHVMFLHNEDVECHNAMFNNLGRTDKKIIATIDTGTNPKGRYAVHFHRSGGVPTQVPAVIMGCVVNTNPGWGFVNHESNVLVEDNVAYNCDGANFFSEMGTELGTFKRNLAVKSIGDGRDGPLDADNREDETPSAALPDYGFAGHGFWFQQGGSGLVIEENVAVSNNHDGFNFFAGKPTNDVQAQHAFFSPWQKVYLPAAYQSLVPAGATTIRSDRVPFKASNNNIAFNNQVGFEVWYSIYKAPSTDGPEFIEHTMFSEIRDGLVWNPKFKSNSNSAVGLFSVYCSQLKFINMRVYNHNAQGYGATSNTQFYDGIFDGVTITGWSMGIRIPTTEKDLLAGRGLSYNGDGLGLSHIKGGTFRNVQNFGYTSVFGDNTDFTKDIVISHSPTCTLWSGSNTAPTVPQFTASRTGTRTYRFQVALGSDSDGKVASYTYDFGDGTQNRRGGRDFTYVFPANGTYTVSMRCYDDDGSFASRTLALTVN